MLSGRDIVCFANDWHNDPTSKHQIMKLLSRENKILWVNSIGLRKPTPSRADAARVLSKIRSFTGGLERVNPNLHVFSPVVLPSHRGAFARAVNGIILESTLRFYMKQLGMTDVIVWSYLPNTAYIIARLKRELTVYHCVDEWSRFSFIDSRITEDEDALCRMADLVITSAASLFERCRPHNPNTHYVSHGVDYNHFRDVGQAAAPRDIAAISRPIAGFFGLIHEWIDLDLVEAAASMNPEINFVFIGKCGVDVSVLAPYRNVHFLGQKPYHELVAYASCFDLGLIPFKVNELTINVNPIKLKEYLALGLPVISVDLPEVRRYSHIVRIVKNQDEFARSIRPALEDPKFADVDEIRRVAESETWEKKVDEIAALIRASEDRN